MNTIYRLHIDNKARAKQPVNLAKSETDATLYLYDVISADWGVSAMNVIDAIAQAGDAPVLNIRINSPGGDVFESRAIMSAIRAYAGKTVAHIDSLCASAATSIALACDEVIMSDGGLFMIHNAHGAVFGDKNDMRERAELLEKVEMAIVDDYTAKTKMAIADITAMMNSETWMTAKEALAHGFIDSIAPARKTPGNAWNLSAFKNAPAPPDPAPEPQTEPAQAAGFFMSEANANHLALSLL